MLDTESSFWIPASAGMTENLTASITYAKLNNTVIFMLKTGCFVFLFFYAPHVFAAHTAHIEVVYPPSLYGGVKIAADDLVKYLKKMGGKTAAVRQTEKWSMDEKGTRGLIANLLNLPANQLPDAISFEAAFKAVPVSRNP